MTRYILDSTVLITHLRKGGIFASLQLMMGAGNVLSTTCVNIAEIERGMEPRQRKPADELLARLEFLPTTREAALRAGRYQAEWRRRGRTLAVADALIAGTARAHGAVLVTDNVADFPMRDIRVLRPERALPR